MNQPRYQVIDGPMAPHTESEILKREKAELKQELSELRQIMLRQVDHFSLSLHKLALNG